MVDRKLVFVLFAGLLGGLAVPGSTARADGDDARRSFVFDVQVIQVRTKTLGPAYHGKSMGFDLAEALTALRQRGSVTVLMDQRITAMEGDAASAATDHALPIRRFDTADNTLERVRFDNLKSGCTVQLYSDDGVLEYDIVASWLFWPTVDRSVPSGRTTWKGRVAASGAGTFTLRGREHVFDADGAQSVVEVYCFVTTKP